MGSGDGVCFLPLGEAAGSGPGKLNEMISSNINMFSIYLFLCLSCLVCHVSVIYVVMSCHVLFALSVISFVMSCHVYFVFTSVLYQSVYLSVYQSVYLSLY